MYNLKGMKEDTDKTKEELIEELKNLRKDLERLKNLAQNRFTRYCFYDKLTHLFNRAYFEEELRRLDTIRQLPLSIIIGDINGLKLVNDAFGHREGDKLLVKSGRFLRESCRKEDIISRWGGDEFAILLPKTSLEAAEEVISRIEDCCKKIYDTKIPLSISLGVACKVDQEQNINLILKTAEENMYKKKFRETIDISNSIISYLENSLWEKSHESKEDLDRIKKLAIKLGKKINLNDSEIEKLELLAAIHDIGKVAILEHILDKSAALDEKDWEIIRKHSEVGYYIAKSSEKLATVAEAIMTHHEWWNGKGYPFNLKGEGIPVISRVISIVDAYDAMINDRPFKKAVTSEEAVKELKRLAGKQFDPKFIDAFVEIIGSENN
ncbi:MAG: diguanylate cyclase [Actinobacteria bacterium]|nr:diguanylate cyclase [Actinomycetota bacterium]